MKIRYLTPLRYPSKYTNRFQVIKMSEAFSKQCDFVLFVERFPKDRGAIWKEYQVAYSYDIREIGMRFLWPKSFWLAMRYRHYIECEPEETMYYIRDILLAYWLTYVSPKFTNKFFFENHSLEKFSDRIYRRVFSKASGIITTNMRKKDDITRLFGIPHEKVLVFGNGIDMKEFQNLPDSQAARIKAGYKDIRGPLVVYTGTKAESYGSGVIERIQRIFAGGKIHVVAVHDLPREEALLVIAAADIVIAPYLAASDHFRYYMSPMKIKEYMAAEKPIIASDLPAIREILSDDAAYFVPPGEPEALAGMIRHVIAHPEEAKAKAQRARALAEHFSWDRRAEAVINFMAKRV